MFALFPSEEKNAFLIFYIPPRKLIGWMWRIVDRLCTAGKPGDTYALEGLTEDMMMQDKSNEPGYVLSMLRDAIEWRYRMPTSPVYVFLYCGHMFSPNRLPYIIMGE